MRVVTVYGYLLMTASTRTITLFSLLVGLPLCLALAAGFWWGVRPFLAPTTPPTATPRPAAAAAVTTQTGGEPASVTATLMVIEQVASLTPTPTPSATPTLTPTPTNTPTPSRTPSPTATHTPTITPSPTPDVGPEELTLGFSANGRPIEAVRFGAGPQVILLIGGFHAGFAPSTVALAEQAIAHYRQNLAEIPANTTLLIVRNANPDSPNDPGGVSGRLNGNRVDPNRNWDCNWRANAVWSRNPVSGGPEPFSEPEVQALLNVINERNVTAVIFWEARATGGLASPGGCGDSSLVSVPLAAVYGNAAGYRVGDFEAIANYALTGDGTNWLDSQGIPAVAILLPSYTQFTWPVHLAGIRAVIRSYGE